MSFWSFLTTDLTLKACGVVECVILIWWKHNTVSAQNSYFTDWSTNNVSCHYSHTGGVHKDVTNLGSYNYLGFAENSGPCSEDAIESVKKYGAGVCGSRMEMGMRYAVLCILSPWPMHAILFILQAYYLADFLSLKTYYMHV